MTQDIKNVIEKIKSNYDVNISSVEEQEDGTVYLTIKDKLYTVYPAQNDQYYSDIVYYIAADADLYTKADECTNVSDMGVIPVSEADDSDPRKQAGPYRYITKHGIGPGTLPKDVKLVKWEDLDDYKTAIWTDRFLTTQELEDYDIYPESVQENLDVEEKTDDQELTEVINSNPSLLVALDSEKDAKITYSTLIEIEESSENPDQEVIDLLKKILADELEHIALLSAQQAKQTSQFVAEDSQGEFESVIDDIKEE